MTAVRGRRHHPAAPRPSRYPRASPWVGWIGFAGVLMVMLGALHAFQGLVAHLQGRVLPGHLQRPGGDARLHGLGLDATSSSGDIVVSPGSACWPARCGRGSSASCWRR